MPYIRKTRDEYTIQQYTGELYGWEDETTEETRPAARAQLRTYQDNAPGQYRIIRRRVSLEQDRRELIESTLERINRHHGSGDITRVEHTATGGTVHTKRQYGSACYTFHLLEGDRIRYRGITRKLGYTIR